MGSRYKPLRVLLFGAGGQVGRELTRSLAPLGSITALTRQDFDLADPHGVNALVDGARPDIVVNAAAYTAVDRAESEPDEAHLLNAVVPGLLAEAAENAGALFIHYSTDYVFEGTSTSAIPETATPSPHGVYGVTKRAGEEAVVAIGGRSIILRTSWVYAAHGHNFLRTMLRLGGERDHLRVVDDQWGSPTSAPWLADTTATVIRRALDEGVDGPDLVHATCAGETTWYGFAQAIFERWPPTTALTLEPVATAAYPTPAQRPAYSVLDTRRLRERYGVLPPHWKDALVTLDLHEAVAT
jgi:dTDP-4-dehydrorhamnose reductase